ncbi:MAG: MoaD/ThiS family protein [Pirellulales bacterium]
MASTTIRVWLPFHLRTLAQVATAEVQLDVPEPVTQRTLLDALEAAYPALRGTVRDYATGQRRPFLRFFACQQDLSLDPPDKPLPEPVLQGTEAYLIIGGLAGG